MIITSTGSPDHDPIGDLLAARRRRRDAAADEEVAVHRARARGMTWATIAHLLGERRRTVRSRYGGSRRTR